MYHFSENTIATRSWLLRLGLVFAAYAALQGAQTNGFASEPSAQEDKDKVTIVFPEEALEHAGNRIEQPSAQRPSHTPALEIQQLYYSDPGKEASKVINLTIKRPDGLLRSKTEIIPASAKAPQSPKKPSSCDPQPTHSEVPTRGPHPPTSASLSLPCSPSTQVSVAPKR